MKGSPNQLLKKLESISVLSKGNRLSRLYHKPFAYSGAIIFNSFLYPFFKEGISASTTTFFGTSMKVVLPAGTDLYLLGAKSHDSELRLCAGLISFLQPRDTVLDIGAHFGFFSLLAAHLCGEDGMIYAIEPSTRTHEILTENIKAFPFIQGFKMAMGEQEDSITFYEFPLRYSEYNSTSTEQYALEPWFKQNKPTKNTVRLRKIDDFLLENNFQPRLIKIDAEGSEDRVIEGGVGFLKNNSPLVVMEYLAKSSINTAHRQAAHKLIDLGYKVFVSDMQGDLLPVSDIESYFKATGLDSENFFFQK
jgi:FkbM family methyltransferase